MMMDPTTIGLLISIAPTILDLLFSERDHSDIKQETVTKKMYGYGLEGYGYRYPTLAEEYALLPYQTSRGTIQKAVRVPSKKWVAAYVLNKNAVKANSWVDFLKKKMDILRQEYYTDVLKQDKPPEKVKRIRHKLMAEAISRIPELAAIEKLPEEELIKLYYEGSVPRSKEVKRKLLKVLPGPPVEQVLLPVAKK